MQKPSDKSGDTSRRDFMKKSVFATPYSAPAKTSEDPWYKRISPMGAG